MGSWRDHRSNALGREEARRNLGLLLVDDEPSILESLEEVFKRHFVTYTATSGAEALGIVREHAPVLVVSDQRMPGLSGLDLMAAIKEIAPDTVRILLTGYSETDVVMRALNEGLLFKFLLKPWEQEELVAAVMAGAEAHLRGHGAMSGRGILGC